MGSASRSGTLSPRKTLMQENYTAASRSTQLRRPTRSVTSGAADGEGVSTSSKQKQRHGAIAPSLPSSTSCCSPGGVPSSDQQRTSTTRSRSSSSQAHVDRCRLTSTNGDGGRVGFEAITLDFDPMRAFGHIDDETILTLRPVPPLPVNQHARTVWLHANRQRTIR